MTFDSAASDGDSLTSIDALIHAPARLKIMTQLYVLDAADATYLMNRSGLTWGNLSTHLTRLEAGGYVTLEKGFVGKKPRTLIRLTDKGRENFQDYRASMRQLLDILPE
jgi:DNA-binding MarR family transcriptional regulator